MSGGEPSSIKRDEMCREGSGSERMLAEGILSHDGGLFRPLFFVDGRRLYVSAQS